MCNLHKYVSSSQVKYPHFNSRKLNISIQGNEHSKYYAASALTCLHFQNEDLHSKTTTILTKTLDFSVSDFRLIELKKMFNCVIEIIATFYFTVSLTENNYNPQYTGRTSKSEAIDRVLFSNTSSCQAFIKVLQLWIIKQHLLSPNYNERYSYYFIKNHLIFCTVKLV